MRVRLFKPQFARLVEAGTKRQTIRPMPKRLPRAGDLESWREWTGLPYRSKQRELARVRILSVEEITITSMGISVGKLGNVLTMKEEDLMAEKDGFQSLTQFVEWFDSTHRLPFTGIVIVAETL